MAAVGFPALDIVYAFLLLVPGFLSLQLALFYGKVSPGLNRFQQTAWSLIGSGISISLLYFMYLLSGLVYVSATGHSPEALILFPEIGSVQFAIGFPALVAVSLLVGRVSGHVIDERIRSGTNDVRESTWRFTKKYSEDPIQVRIVTNTGHEILGEVLNAGSENERHDVLLSYPYRIIRNGAQETDRVSVGKFAYVREEDIAHMYFENDINPPNLA